MWLDFSENQAHTRYQLSVDTNCNPKQTAWKLESRYIKLRARNAQTMLADRYPCWPLLQLGYSWLQVSATGQTLPSRTRDCRTHSNTHVPITKQNPNVQAAALTFGVAIGLIRDLVPQSPTNCTAVRTHRSVVSDPVVKKNCSSR